MTHQSAPAGSTSFATTGTDSYGYDAAGETTAAPGQVLAYDPQGELTSVTAGGKTQTRVYDAAGNLLVRSDPTSGTTAFVGDTELTVNPAGQVSASRSFAAGGSVFACRTSAPGGLSSVLTWLAGDAQGTATVAVDATTGAASVRWFDPFGADRDVVAPSWPNRDGFLGAPTDVFTGTTRLGARDYNPSLGRFLTVDPVLDTAVPQQSVGYAYAMNNPVTDSDRSGLDPAGPCSAFDERRCAAPPPAPSFGSSNSAEHYNNGYTGDISLNFGSSNSAEHYSNGYTGKLPASPKPRPAVKPKSGGCHGFGCIGHALHRAVHHVVHAANSTVSFIGRNLDTISGVLTVCTAMPVRGLDVACGVGAVATGLAGAARHLYRATVERRGTPELQGMVLDLMFVGAGAGVAKFAAPEVVKDPLYGRTALHFGRLGNLTFGGLGLGVTWREDHGG